jgi:protease I
MSEVLMVVPQTMFRDEEYAEPRRAFDERGARVTVASTDAGACVGRFGLVVEADISMADVDGTRYDAIVFVGGRGAADLFDDANAHRLARDAFGAGSVVGAICIAPSILARAGLLDGRRATAYRDQMDDLLAHGADWTGELVTVDAPFVTGNGPEAATEFGKAVVRLARL